MQTQPKQTVHKLHCAKASGWGGAVVAVRGRTICCTLLRQRRAVHGERERRQAAGQLPRTCFCEPLPIQLLRVTSNVWPNFLSGWRLLVRSKSNLRMSWRLETAHDYCQGWLQLDVKYLNIPSLGRTLPDKTM